MTPTELIGSVHTLIAALHYFTSQYKEYLYDYMDVQAFVNLFSEGFQQFCYIEKERKNSYTNLLLSCHQLEPPERTANRES